jgi:hypothetical protein
MMVMRASFRILTLAAVVAASTSCGDAARTGRSPAFLEINLLVAAPGGGANKGTSSTVLLSDVITLITSGGSCTPAVPCPTIFNDIGTVTMTGEMKNTTIAPTPLQAVTIDRYHVEYVRADGHNTPGVDVPYPFDGGVTQTIQPAGLETFSFEIVRHDAKQESPLVQLINSNNIITTICNVTFYGHDQAGNEMNVTGSIQIDFGNFADQ